MKKASALFLTAALLVSLSGCKFIRDESSTSSDTDGTSTDTMSDTSSQSTGGNNSELPVGYDIEKVTLYGTPSETLSEFNFDKFIERYDNFIELNELLDSLGKPEVKEVYIKALAMLDGFADGGYLLPSKERVCIDVDDGSINGATYVETGYSYDSFIGAMNEIFCEAAVENILEGMPWFYEYEDALWQAEISLPTFNIHSEYEIVENLDDEVQFNTINYYIDDPAEDFDPEKRDSYKKRTLNNSIIKNADGWLVQDCTMFGSRCARWWGDIYNERVANVDFYEDVPEDWIPVCTDTEAFENYDSIVSETIGGDDPAAEIVRKLMNRNVLAFDIIHGRGWEIDNSNVGDELVIGGSFPIISKYFSSLEELNELFFGTYTVNAARDVITVSGCPAFSEDDGVLNAFLLGIPAWNTVPFIHRTYAEVMSASDDIIEFKWHYVDVGDPDYWERAAEMSFTIIKTSYGFRLTSPVFDNPELDQTIG